MDKETKQNNTTKIINGLKKTTDNLIADLYRLTKEVEYQKGKVKWLDEDNQVLRNQLRANRQYMTNLNAKFGLLQADFDAKFADKEEVK